MVAQGSKDSKSSLVSKGKFEQNTSDSRYGPRPKWPKTYLTYDVSHNKSKTKKKFFSLQSQRLAESFKGLNSSLAQ